jgi:putative ubiquitin-RnfH superfamily antitoxin RatB of RatAB toxin-antitoxin module
MIDPASMIAMFQLATWAMRAINESEKYRNLTEKRLAGTKSLSSAISKIDRQLKDAELKYYQDKTKRDRALLAIEKQRLANDNIRIEIEEARLGIDSDRLKLEKQERKDRLEISRLHRELLKEIQAEEAKVKLQGKQIDWDNSDLAPFLIGG